MVNQGGKQKVAKTEKGEFWGNNIQMSLELRDLGGGSITIEKHGPGRKTGYQPVQGKGGAKEGRGGSENMGKASKSCPTRTDGPNKAPAGRGILSQQKRRRMRDGPKKGKDGQKN